MKNKGGVSTFMVLEECPSDLKVVVGGFWGDKSMVCDLWLKVR